MAKTTFDLWAFGDAHVGTDLKKNRHSLYEALRHSEQGGDRGGPAFNWDIAIDGSIFATFYHQGQVCESGTRLLLPAAQHDDFVAQMVAKE